MKRCIFLLIAAFIIAAGFGVSAGAYDQANSMVKISGTYGGSFGINSGEFYWKEANGDYQEKNFRYIGNDLNVNTYDPRIFDRYQLEVETDTRTPWNGYAELVFDPWSFVGVGKQTVHAQNLFGRADNVTVKYRYWEATGKTINQTFRTYRGNYIYTDELKVIQDKVTHDLVQSRPMPAGLGQRIAYNLSLNRSVEIDHLFRPVRKLWVEYNEEPLYVKAFPMADQAEALTTDDPLKLSNNHVYWAPSPWLFRFNPGMSLLNAIDPAKWDWDLAWFAEDSNRNYLTFLRGVALEYKVKDIAEIKITGATPMSLWDYYEEVDSIPIAARAKFYPSNRITAGATYTSKYGIYKKRLRAVNQVMGMDAAYHIADETDIFGEYAVSYEGIEHPGISRQRFYGLAWTAGMKSEVKLDERNKFDGDISFTWMGEDFRPGLSDYKDTRVDREWGRHIWFDPLSPDDQHIRIGNSIDVNRYVLGLNAHADISDKLFDFYFNFRNAHESVNGKFIESILRLEAICNPYPNLQIKGLGLYRVHPLSVGGLDPLIRSRYTDDRILNAVIPDGKNADVATISGGAKLDLLDGKVSVYGIYEATNDPQDFPRGILNDLTREVIGESDIRFDRLVPFLYSQYLFDFPPYRFYSIAKAVLTVKPVDNLSVKYTHVTNGNRNYAALFDNNHNHDSIELTYDIAKDMDFHWGYSLSRVLDIPRANNTEGYDMQFRPHHNIFAQLNWKLKNDQKLTFMFGEAWIQNENPGVFSTRWPSTRVSVLDTRRIFRMFFQGKF